MFKLPRLFALQKSTPSEKGNKVVDKTAMSTSDFQPQNPPFI